MANHSPIRFDLCVILFNEALVAPINGQPGRSARAPHALRAGVLINRILVPVRAHMARVFMCVAFLI